MTSQAYEISAATETDFGFNRVPLQEKQGLVNGVFHSVASRYDLMNDVMSLGQHRLWKDALVRELNPRSQWRHLDVAGGTGDVAFRIARAAGLRSHITVSDINRSMLDVGEQRARDEGLLGQLSFVEANAEILPFERNLFDGYTIAFGIRNVPRRESALQEAYRVLKHGGRFLCLEFSHVDVPVLEQLYKAYSFKMIPGLGAAIAGDANSYRYLVESIAQFPTAETFSGTLLNSGFSKVSFSRLSGGIVTIHSAWKL
jgi:demethylmenaquinone methyltransferase/2-methoxy-6-polyprenyl-1,4-benzoquinol methylase